MIYLLAVVKNKVTYRLLRPSCLPILLVMFFLLSISTAPAQKRNLYNLESGIASFDSDAPLEIIQASTKDLSGIIDIDKNTFGFIIPIASFDGFNSSLQREHFNENYLESSLYPKAKFYGKIEGEFDLLEPGEYTVSTRGVMEIHDVRQNRAINATIIVRPDGTFDVSSVFLIRLDDHKIRVPSVVRYKIAEVITVSIESHFVQR